jgi:hypothetical protein
MKTRIKSEIRSELERRGADSVRALLTAMSNADSGTGRETTIRIGDMTARRGEIEDWLKSQAAQGACWVKVGTIAAIFAAILSFLAWIFPLK